eukprot:SAG31_NODE_45_length_31062_cov_17.179957_17_plen_331_part_00
MRQATRSVALGGGNFGQLAEVLAEHWPNPDDRPKLVGPDDGGTNTSCVQRFLGDVRDANATMHAFNYHFYLQVNSTTVSAHHLDQLRGYASRLAAAVQAAGGGETQIWAGETGGHGHGGVAGVTDVYASAQWYLDSLGTLATLGHKVHVRKDLVGANYGLLRDKFPYGCQDAQSCGTAANDVYHALPDYFATVLWKQLMGTGVLNVTAVDGPAELRVYAHCTRGRAHAMTLLLINVDSLAHQVVTLPEPTGGGYQLWRMTPPAGNLSSSQVELNGRVLSINPDGSLPPLAGTAYADSALSIAPSTYAFLVVPGAAPQCGHGERSRLMRPI